MISALGVREWKDFEDDLYEVPANADGSIRYKAFEEFLGLQQMKEQQVASAPRKLLIRRQLELDEVATRAPPLPINNPIELPQMQWGSIVAL